MNDEFKCKSESRRSKKKNQIEIEVKHEEGRERRVSENNFEHFEYFLF